MDTQPLISVVLATYNGSKYLRDQLDSIYQQTYKNIEVIVCDDQSTDGTKEILKAYKQSHQLKYYINEKRLGVVQNFAKAISLSTGDYIALSDQDDVWLPEKLELSFKKIRELEQRYSKQKPLLVYTDLAVVDEDLKSISPSYWRHMRLNQKNLALNRILVENFMTGCTALMNRATAEMALPIPGEALMHDVWFLLVAFCFGKTAYLEKQTILYRQHSNNVVGSIHKSKIRKLNIALVKIRNKKLGLLNEEIEQAKAFYRIFRTQLMDIPRERQVLETFITLKEKNIINRKYSVIKNAFYGNTFGRLLNTFLRV
jgi:glycosyltransferase involved in cell wall biosynthesis